LKETTNISHNAVLLITVIVATGIQLMICNFAFLFFWLYVEAEYNNLNLLNNKTSLINFF
jgi:hypothetical protein